MTLAIPSIVRNKARIAGAADWVESLPHLVRDLELEWSLTAGTVFVDATEALVLEAALEDGTEAVLKIHIPRKGDHAAHEITVLQLASGEGCPTLFRHDEERGVLLMERLGPSMADLDLPLEERQRGLCESVMRLWRPASGADLPTGAEKGRWLMEFIAATWERLGRPCSSRAVEHALECAERRIEAHDPDRAMLVHGDIHQWNALRAGDGFKLVDPDGLLADPEYRHRFRRSFDRRKLGPTLWHRDFHDARIVACPDESLIGLREQLDQLDAPTLGVVVNGDTKGSDPYYYYSSRN